MTSDIIQYEPILLQEGKLKYSHCKSKNIESFDQTTTLLMKNRLGPYSLGRRVWTGLCDNRSRKKNSEF